MNKVTDTITGAIGIGTIETIAHVEQITEGGGLLIQIIVGIITLIKLLKKKKNADNEKL